MSEFDLSDLMEAAAKVVIPTIPAGSHGGGGKATFGVVNNVNGKRLTFSKALTEVLELGNTVNLVPVAEKGLLIAGKIVPNQKPINCKLSSSGGKKISYSANAVAQVTASFGLTFDSCTSQSFDDVRIEKYEDSPVAIITVYDKAPETASTQVGGDN